MLHGELTGVGKLQADPYALRHGGASHDSLYKRRGYEDRKQRGRWRTDASVRRYDKHARLLKEINRMPVKTQEYAAQIQERLNEFLRFPRRTPAPPYADGLGRWRTATGDPAGTSRGQLLRPRNGCPINPAPPDLAAAQRAARIAATLGRPGAVRQAWGAGAAAQLARLWRARVRCRGRA